MTNNSFKNNYQYVFKSGNGLCGGNQSSPKTDALKYAHIVRRYYPKFTDRDIKKFLYRLSTEGCGYVALVNIIFLRFYGDPEGFEATFNLPMFTPEGELNFNDLIVDFYSATDNHRKGLFFDYISRTEDYAEDIGSGVGKIDSKYRFEMYMKKHNIPVQLDTVSITPGYYERRSEEGPITVSIYPNRLYNATGNVVVDRHFGHTMTVIGYHSPEFLKVSSWGREYYIKHGSYSGYEYYQQVTWL